MNVLLCITSLQGQEIDVNTQYTVGEYDSSYVHSYNSYLMPRFLVNRKYTRMELFNRDEDYSLRFIPNKTVSAGLGVTYKFATLNLSFGILKPDEERGETRNLDIQLHRYGRRFTTDLIAQFYKGFYLSDQSYASGTNSYYVRPDLAVTALGGSFQYVFNHRKFSYRAAFQQTELQKKSAGTFLLGFELYMGRFRGDSTLIPESIAERVQNPTLRKMRFIEIGPNIGYAYTWVYKKYFIAAGASIGINAGISRFYDNTGGNTIMGVSPNSIIRFSSGYNVRHWAINVLYISTALHLPRIEERSVIMNTGNIRLNFIYRIYPVGNLKKAVRLIDSVDRKLKKKK